MLTERRKLLRFGALLLLIAIAFGLLAAVPVQPASRWLASHVTTLILGVLVMALGLLWPDLRLSDGRRSAAFRLIQISIWAGLLLSVATALLDIPGPVSDSGVQPSGLQAPVLFTLLAIIVPCTIASFVLVWHGLRGPADK